MLQLLIEFSPSLFVFFLSGWKGDLYDEAWRAVEKILISWIVATSGPGTTAKDHLHSQSPFLNFAQLDFIFSKRLQNPLLVLSEEDKGRFQDKLGDSWRWAEVSVSRNCSRETCSALTKFIFGLFNSVNSILCRRHLKHNGDDTSMCESAYCSSMDSSPTKPESKGTSFYQAVHMAPLEVHHWFIPSLNHAISYKYLSSPLSYTYWLPQNHVNVSNKK